jgi:hypothetical protein
MSDTKIIDNDNLMSDEVNQSSQLLLRGVLCDSRFFGGDAKNLARQEVNIKYTSYIYIKIKHIHLSDCLRNEKVHQSDKSIAYQL